jgi:hypothetical protein
MNDPGERPSPEFTSADEPYPPNPWQPSDELEALFDLQRARMERTRPLWQLLTGEENVQPDLGRLLDWLIARLNVDALARELHATKGGGPFGVEGDCECEAQIRDALTEALR